MSIPAVPKAPRIGQAEGEECLAFNLSQSDSAPDSEPSGSRAQHELQPQPPAHRLVGADPKPGQVTGSNPDTANQPADLGDPEASCEERGAGKRGRWTPEELRRLEDLYGRRDDATIARELGRTVAGVRAQAQKLFAERQRSGPWSAEETERLKEYIGASSTDVIARIFGRHPREVNEHIEALDAKLRTGDWTRDEVQRLRQLYGRRMDQDLARILGRPIEEIQEKAIEYALRKDKAFVRKLEGTSATRMPRWTEQELQVLREVYPLRPNLEIAHQLKRSVKSVVSKAYHLGLKKDPERLREMGRENVALRYEEDGADS